MKEKRIVNKYCALMLVAAVFSAIIASLASPLMAATDIPLGPEERIPTSDSDEGLILVYAAQDDVYTKLKESAELNIVTAGLIRCFYTESELYWQYDLSDTAKGKVLQNGWSGDVIILGELRLEDKTTTLWLENMIKRNGRDKVKGSFSCSDGKDIDDEEWAKYTGIFPVYAAYINRHDNYPDIYCRTKDGVPMHGVLKKTGNYYKDGWPTGISLDKYCYDVTNDNIEQYPEDAVSPETTYSLAAASTPPWGAWLELTYRRYTEDETADLQLFGRTFNGNQFAPNWTDIGTYSNVDGYFNYMRDFNFKCRAKIHETDPQKETAPGVTTLEPDYSGLRIVAKRRWYEVTENKEWSYSFGAGKYNNCILLLNRIEFLRSHPNGTDPIYRDGKDASEEMRNFIDKSRKSGYEGIILYALEQACLNMVDQKTGKNAWEAELEALNEFLARTDIPEDDELRIIAEEDLAKLQSAIATGIYMETSGKETETGGKVYQCLDLQTMQIDLAKYTPASSIIPTEEDDWRKEPNCYQKAGPLGWILCPIIDGLRQFIIEKYHEWVEPALQMNATLFTVGDSPVNGTYKAWKVFRDIGNLLFILFFIFVIFSQVTGVGIDNYGIKRSLPKLFVAAVLINLSFLICQISVDVSNIAGSQIGAFIHTTTLRLSRPGDLYIEGTTVRKYDQGSWGDTDTWGKSFKAGWLGNSALIITVAAIGIGAVLSKGIAIIIPVLLLLVGVAISVIGLIIILGIRQAAAVLLVVVSPLAFVCYMLPNTKSVFDKWFDAFKGLLVAYPICSMVVYGSDMAATILMNAADGNTWIVIAAAAISIFPIFAIPKVIKQSVGAISGGIAALSSRASRSAKGKVGSRLRASRMGDRERYSNYMRNQKQSQAYGAYSARKGRRIVKKYNKKMKKGGVLNRPQQRMYNAALGAVNAQNRLNAQASASAFAGKDDASIRSELQNSSSKGKLDADMVASALSSMQSEAQATAAIREMSKTDAWQKMMKSDPQANSRIASAMAGRSKSVINQSIGKLMNKGMSVESIFANNSAALRDKVNEVDENALLRQDASTFDTEGAADLFSDGQLRTIMSAGYTGQAADSVYNMMSGVNDDRKQIVATGMSDNQISNLNMSISENGEDHGSFAALGGEKSFRTSTGEYSAGVQRLNSSAGEHLRANMNAGVMGALHIDGTGNSAKKAKNNTVSGEIDLNNMTEDDYQYIKWQHEHNPGNGSKSD